MNWSRREPGTDPKPERGLKTRVVISPVLSPCQLEEGTVLSFLSIALPPKQIPCASEHLEAAEAQGEVSKAGTISQSRTSVHSEHTAMGQQRGIVPL